MDLRQIEYLTLICTEIVPDKTFSNGDDRVEAKKKKKKNTDTDNMRGIREADQQMKRHTNSSS
jgi:hypothetical protein